MQLVKARHLKIIAAILSQAGCPCSHPPRTSKRWMMTDSGQCSWLGTANSQHSSIKFRDSAIGVCARLPLCILQWSIDTVTEFTAETESMFSNCHTPSDIHSAERQFRKIITRSAGHHIAAGKIPRIHPGFPSEAAQLATEWDSIRATDTQSPRIAELKADIQRIVDQHKR